jgi:hypothetical protein
MLGKKGDQGAQTREEEMAKLKLGAGLCVQTVGVSVVAGS